MLDRYKTVRQAGSKEIVIKKSRFIGHVMPVETEEEAVALLKRSRKTLECYP